MIEYKKKDGTIVKIPSYNDLRRELLKKRKDRMLDMFLRAQFNASEAIEKMAAEDKQRKEQGYPTVEEELRQMGFDTEGIKERAKAKIEELRRERAILKGTLGQ